MALYPKAVHKLIRPGTNDPRITPRQAVVHVDAGNATTLYGWFTNPKADGVESHFHVRRDGVVEQYRDTNYQADAQVGGAREAVSIETQGYESGEWTAAQVAALVALLEWLCTVHPGIPRRVCPGPSSAGIGYHSMWPSSMAGTWARDGRTCPGPRRIVQFRDTIMPALTGTRPLEDIVQPSDIAAIAKATADEVLTRRLIDTTGAERTVGFAIGATLRDGQRLAVRVAGLEAALGSLTELLEQQNTGAPMPTAAEVLATIRAAADARMAALTFEEDPA